jgi:hypothetical protein
MADASKTVAEPTKTAHDPAKTVFVNRFPATWTKAHLEGLFGACGTIESLDVKGKAKLAYITFADADGAVAAVALNKKEVGGGGSGDKKVAAAIINVQHLKASCKQCRSADHSTTACPTTLEHTAYVANFPKTWAEQDLGMFFMDNGVEGIKAASLQQHRNGKNVFAFVAFNDDASRDAAVKLHETAVGSDGDKIRIEARASNKCKFCGATTHTSDYCSEEAMRRADKLHKCYVTGYPESWKSVDILKHFSDNGAPCRANACQTHHSQSGRHAFVNLDDAAGVETALSLNNKIIGDGPEVLKVERRSKTTQVEKKTIAKAATERGRGRGRGAGGERGRGFGASRGRGSDTERGRGGGRGRGGDRGGRGGDRGRGGRGGDRGRGGERGRGRGGDRGGRGGRGFGDRGGRGGRGAARGSD